MLSASNWVLEAFWPGPLSIVAPARRRLSALRTGLGVAVPVRRFGRGVRGSVVPPEVTARTGFVAVRCPAHPIARREPRAEPERRPSVVVVSSAAEGQRKGI